MFISKNNPFRWASILQLFIATGTCIYFSAQENIQLPNVSSVDKILHLIAFFIYGLSLQFFFIALFQKNKTNNKKYAILTIIVGFTFALSDEIHQYFVPGRRADIIDLLVDWLGICLSLLCIKIVNTIYIYFCSKTEKIPT